MSRLPNINDYNDIYADDSYDDQQAESSQEEDQHPAQDLPPPVIGGLHAQHGLHDEEDDALMDPMAMQGYPGPGLAAAGKALVETALLLKDNSGIMPLCVSFA